MLGPAHLLAVLKKKAEQIWPVRATVESMPVRTSSSVIDIQSTIPNANSQELFTQSLKIWALQILISRTIRYWGRYPPRYQGCPRNCLLFSWGAERIEKKLKLLSRGTWLHRDSRSMASGTVRGWDPRRRDAGPSTPFSLSTPSALRRLPR